MSAQESPRTACVIVIGNEILSGRTRDANLAFIGSRCDALGIALAEARVIRDLETEIVAHVNECRTRFDYVFTTGGIGPTHDDITSRAIARAFDAELERNADAVAALERRYDRAMLNDARLRMAEMPVGVTLIENPVSGAPGFQIKNVFVLPGVPEIMQAMFDGITDRLIGGPPVLTSVIATNLAEGTLAQGLGAIQARFHDVTIGSYPYFRRGSLGVNLVLRATETTRLEAASREIRELIAGLGGELLSG